jgi:hypothetical protein
MHGAQALCNVYVLLPDLHSMTDTMDASYTGLALSETDVKTGIYIVL